MEHGAAVEAVCARRTDNSPSVRAAVAEALGFASGGSVGPLLRKLLADDVFYVRSHAARAVAHSRDESLADELLPLLADRNWWVRAAAKESLGALGEAGLRIAMAALSHGDAFARDGALEIIAAKGLAEIGGPGDDSDVVRQAVTALRTSSALDVAEVA